MAKNTKIHRILAFLRHRFTSWNTTGEGIHSPYLFYLVRFILRDENTFYSFREIERRRALMLCSEEEMEVVVNLVKAAKYDFPIYFPADGERETFRRDILPRIKYKYFLLGDDDRPRSIGDPVRDEEAYIRFMKALQ